MFYNKQDSLVVSPKSKAGRGTTVGSPQFWATLYAWAAMPASGFVSSWSVAT